MNGRSSPTTSNQVNAQAASQMFGYTELIM
jgi:hypothetical protein